jgi:hypothetical protein
LALAVAFAGTIAGSGLAQRPSEYQVEAAYLYGFGRFVEWPASAPAGSGDAFVICILGVDPFGPRLDEIAADGAMKDKPVRVLRLSQPDQSAPCHTLFISSSEEMRLGAILAALDHRPILTVGDLPQFAQRGGMIGFSVESNRVRFAVNIGAAQDAGLTLNSELLRVASMVLRATPRRN